MAIRAYKVIKTADCATFNYSHNYELIQDVKSDWSNNDGGDGGTIELEKEKIINKLAELKDNTDDTDNNIDEQIKTLEAILKDFDGDDYITYQLY